MRTDQKGDDPEVERGVGVQSWGGVHFLMNVIKMDVMLGSSTF